MSREYTPPFNSDQIKAMTASRQLQDTIDVLTRDYVVQSNPAQETELCSGRNIRTGR